MILPTKGMIFRKKYGGDKESSNSRTYKSFFSKKVSKSHFWVQNKTYIFNTQNLTANDTSLKMEEEVSSKYHKLGEKYHDFLAWYRKKMLYEVIIIAFLRQ